MLVITMLAFGAGTTRTLELGGRKNLVHVPASYDGSVAVPLVLSLHGYWMTPAEQMHSDQFATVSEREGFLVVYAHGSDDVVSGPKIASWNVAGCSESVGPLGDTCFTDRATWGEYPCYASCGVCDCYRCDSNWRCRSHCDVDVACPCQTYVGLWTLE